MESKDSSSNSENNINDLFDMTQVKDSIPSDDRDNEVQQKTESIDGEYFDANESEEGSDEEIDLDEEELLKVQENMSESELEELKLEALNLKKAGNDSFKDANHKEAVLLYTKALNICPLKHSNERSILFANRAAAKIGLDNKDGALLDCNKAIELNPDYLRAILRRAQLYKKLDNLDRCLEDYKRVLELDKNNLEARQACATLPSEIAERNEKLKQEMFGKLKDLGNICLKPFGLSTDNFKMVQDPNTGGYSINFQK